ncbi:hypothetical protein F4780DRAFT_788212 [Xylariomycetidae sp. FL0641]|nr:hypothetical protein F4780DRAFT_788212 [Xylariomycetidae sp. FL0641]
MGANASIPTDPSRKLQIISAGYSRTGTLSMTLALETLLRGPVHHGGTQIVTRDNEHNRLWIKAYKAKDAGDRKAVLKHLRKVTAGFVGITDLPGLSFVSELMEIYPEAKVVLVRRNPENWWQSLKVVMERSTANWWFELLMAPIPVWCHLPTFFGYFERGLLRFAGAPNPENTSVENIHKFCGPHLLEIWNNQVREMVPKAKLLEMELREHWDPLCKFLDMPVPNAAFPRENDGKAIGEYAAKMKRQCLQIWVGVLFVTGLLLCLVFGGVVGQV